MFNRCSMMFHEMEEGKARPYACAFRQDLGKMHAQIAKEEMLKVWNMCGTCEARLIQVVGTL
jgi:hypothetical protein